MSSESTLPAGRDSDPVRRRPPSLPPLPVVPQSVSSRAPLFPPLQAASQQQQPALRPTRRNSLFQPGSSALAATPLTPYSVARPGRPRAASPVRAPPSPRINQGDDPFDGRLRVYGWLLLAATAAYFAFNLFTLVLRHWLIPANSGSRLLEWIRNDKYYCYLIPVFGPVFVFFIFFNWLGMKYFRQNA
ncbi:hypothetical protein HK105_200211 [Polyrhizophydium stewartii]|uniref:Uncharacterized protein n=1 Tax=Polyrhizophydium stewartii TaxID=2732419 RepID=A0ABR4NKY5_9FUNG